MLRSLQPLVAQQICIQPAGQRKRQRHANVSKTSPHVDAEEHLGQLRMAMTCQLGQLLFISHGTVSKACNFTSLVCCPLAILQASKRHDTNKLRSKMLC
jgi:hypothetical protein